MTQATEKLAQAMGKSNEEITVLIAAALADPSPALLDAFLDRFVYLRLAKQEELDQQKALLNAIYEQGVHFHVTRQISKLTRR